MNSAAVSTETFKSCEQEANKIKEMLGFHDYINKHLCSFGRHPFSVVLQRQENAET